MSSSTSRHLSTTSLHRDGSNKDFHGNGSRYLGYNEIGSFSWQKGVHELATYRARRASIRVALLLYDQFVSGKYFCRTSEAAKLHFVTRNRDNNLAGGAIHGASISPFQDGWIGSSCDKAGNVECVRNPIALNTTSATKPGLDKGLRVVWILSLRDVLPTVFRGKDERKTTSTSRGPKGETLDHKLEWSDLNVGRADGRTSFAQIQAWSEPHRRRQSPPRRSNFGK